MFAISWREQVIFLWDDADVDDDEDDGDDDDGDDDDEDDGDDDDDDDGDDGDDDDDDNGDDDDEDDGDDDDEDDGDDDDDDDGDDINPVLDQQASFDFHSTASLKQQSTGRYVAPNGHINLILIHPVFFYSLIHYALWRSSNYQYQKSLVWFDQLSTTLELSTPTKTPHTLFLSVMLNICFTFRIRLSLHC